MGGVKNPLGGKAGVGLVRGRGDTELMNENAGVGERGESQPPSNSPRAPGTGVSGSTGELGEADGVQGEMGTKWAQIYFAAVLQGVGAPLHTPGCGCGCVRSRRAWGQAGGLRAGCLAALHPLLS